MPAFNARNTFVEDALRMARDSGVQPPSHNDAVRNAEYRAKDLTHGDDFADEAAFYRQHRMTSAQHAAMTAAQFAQDKEASILSRAKGSVKLSKHVGVVGLRVLDLTEKERQILCDYIARMREA